MTPIYCAGAMAVHIRPISPGDSCAIAQESGEKLRLYVLSWVLPLLRILLIWRFIWRYFLRRLGGAQEGLLAIDDVGKRLQFLEDALRCPRHETSEETEREIDQEVRALIGQARDQARQILAGQRTTLDRLARLLLEKEAIEGEALRRLISDTGGRPG